VVHLYPREIRSEVEARLRELAREFELKERLYDSELRPGSLVVIGLSSPEIEFSDAVVKELVHAANRVHFVAKPKDTCAIGSHAVLLTINDHATGKELESMPFGVKVVDFAFDHVSRPFVSNLASLISGIGSAAMFVLTLLGQIDTTFGLASGTAAGVLAAAIYARVSHLYRRPTTGVNPP
jgi:hypothetical protein